MRSYFFLDSSFPMIHLLTEQGEKNIALRVSEQEGLDTPRNMAGKSNWIWVDCFTKIPITKKEEEELHFLGYKLCFVSPELEGRPEDISIYKEYIIEQGMHFDAICTKKNRIKMWVN